MVPELVAVEAPPGPGWPAELRRWWDRGDAVLPVDHRLPVAARDRLFAALRPTRRVGHCGGPADTVPGGRPTEEGDALVLATSGTTGQPKGVVLTHGALDAATEAVHRRLAVDPGRDGWLACLPLAHAGGMGVVVRAVRSTTPVTVLPAFDPALLSAAAGSLRREGRTALVSLVATALRRVDPADFRVVVLGGDAAPTWDGPAWPDGRPAPVVVTYGLTETGGGCVYDGVALDGVEVEVTAGTGEVRVRGSVLARAYRGPFGDAPLAGPAGWLATGDGGRFVTGADGLERLQVDGRLAEVIVTGGEKVWPAAVEAVLRPCRGVGAVAVIGRPDEEWGQAVVAVVVPSDPADPPTLDELRRAVRAELAPWAAPTQLQLVDALPVTALGKLRRSALRSRRTG